MILQQGIGALRRWHVPRFGAGGANHKPPGGLALDGFVWRRYTWQTDGGVQGHVPEFLAVGVYRQAPPGGSVKRGGYIQQMAYSFNYLCCIPAFPRFADGFILAVLLMCDRRSSAASLDSARRMLST